MRIYDRGPRRHYEETLRSLGLLLDAEEYRHILLAETDHGYMVSALRYSTDLTRAAESIGRWECVATHFSDRETAATLDAAYGYRGSTHRALHYEKVLRTVGHWVDSLSASRVAILDHGGTLIVRALAPTVTDPPFLMAQFTPAELEAMAVGLDHGRKNPRRWGRDR